MKPNTPREFTRLCDLAKRCGLDARTVRGAVARRELPFDGVRIGKHTMYRTAQIDAFFSVPFSGTGTPTAGAAGLPEGERP